jgi:hypothetical protein
LDVRWKFTRKLPDKNLLSFSIRKVLNHK